MADATAYYERREERARPSKVMREVERQVMLRIIDQRWREHLEEMDYLKEGINLRAMGQKDPLTEWQREGYEMFGSMMKGIAQDFVRYVMHVQVVQQQPQQRQPRRRPSAARAPAPATVAPGVQNLQTTSSDTQQASGFRSGRGQRRGQRRGAGRGPARPRPRRRRSPGTPPGATRRRGQAGDRRQGRVVEDAAQRAVPVRVGQEVQDVPRRRLMRATAIDRCDA